MKQKKEVVDYTKAHSIYQASKYLWMQKCLEPQEMEADLFHRIRAATGPVGYGALFI